MDDDLAVFEPTGGGECPVQWWASVVGQAYLVHYRHGVLTISDDLCTRDLFEQELSPDEHDGAWTDEETNVYLHLIGRALRAGALASLALPTKAEVAAHPLHVAGELPRYHVCVCTRDHAHGGACYSRETYAARDRRR